jgi:hypothetical protein
MADRMDRAELGEQSTSDRASMEQGRKSEESMSAGGRNWNMEEDISARPRSEESIEEDTRSGDEGIDDSQTRRASGGRGEASSVNSEDFSGQGAQKGGSPGQAEGTGYTDDRSSQLQEDGSLSGSQGRHGRSGGRHGVGRVTRTNSDRGRVGGQTAQNPRGRETGEIDRTKM